MDSGPFDALLDRYQSGEATTEELGELDQQLRGDAHKRRMLVERTLLEVHLRKFFGGVAPAATPRPAPTSRRWPTVVAGILILAIALSLLVVLLRSAGGPGAMVESGVVRVNNAATAVVPTQTPFEVGGRIPAVLRLHDGAHAELDAGTRALLHGSTGNRSRRIEVMAGGGKFAVAAGQAPLRIETPAGLVLAASARFTARLSTAANGARTLIVAVSAGAVSVQAGGEPQTLAAGQQGVFPVPPAQ